MSMEGGREGQRREGKKKIEEKEGKYGEKKGMEGDKKRKKGWEGN